VQRRRNLGYRVADHAGPLPWPTRLKGHEFHYSVETVAPATAPLFRLQDAAGSDLPPAGAVRGTVCGSYIHILDRA